MTRSIALAAAAAALLAGCGGDDDKGESSPATPATTTTAAAPAEPEANTFESADVGFTFTYPDGFEQVDDPGDGKVLASVSPTPDDARNGLKVRQTSAQELVFDSYSGQISAQFEEQLGTKVDVRTESVGGIDFGIMEWRAQGLHSTSWFFIASGKTWQLECLSAASQRDAVDAACEEAVGSIEPTG